MPERIVVVGVSGGSAGLGADAQRAVQTADLVVGGRRHLADFAPPASRRVEIGGDVPAVLDAVGAEPGVVCVLASGDPGFFGIVRPLAERFGRHALDVHPAPSSVAVAFARAGLSWDDAVVVSAHGRPLPDAVARVATAPKAAVLASPDSPPEALGRALSDAGAAFDTVVVCTRLGLDGEAVVDTDLPGLANGTWDPLSVVVLARGSGVPPAKTLRWGIDDRELTHRDGMITKAEVRAVVLVKLDLPAEGVVWDVGAGSGSVAIECALVNPRLVVHAVERSPADAERIRANAAAHGAAVWVHEAWAPAAFAELPTPDRVFVGGGGVGVLDAVLERLRPGGTVVATYAAVDRAAAAADRLGSLVQVSISRGERLPDGALRLAALNPVFVVWGPAA